MTQAMTKARRSYARWQARTALLAALVAACPDDLAALVAQWGRIRTGEYGQKENLIFEWLVNRHMEAAWITQRISFVAARVAEGADLCDAAIWRESQWSDSELSGQGGEEADQATLLARCRERHPYAAENAALGRERQVLLSERRAHGLTAPGLEKRRADLDRRQKELRDTMQVELTRRAPLWPIEAYPTWQTLKEFEAVARRHYRARMKLFRERGYSTVRVRPELQKLAQQFVAHQLGRSYAELAGARVTMSRDGLAAARGRRAQREAITKGIRRFGALVELFSRLERKDK